MSFVALLLATAVPLAFLYIVYTLDLYSTGSFRAIVLCFLWGGAAVLLAYFANMSLVYCRLSPFSFAAVGQCGPLLLAGLAKGVLPGSTGLITFDTLVKYVAPVTEEFLKALVLVYLVRRPGFTYFVDGAIYGFAVGVGFAVFENYFYSYNNPGAEFSAAVGRVLSSNLVHAAASALVGIALGIARFKRFHRRAAFLLLGLLSAIALHMAFNNLVFRVSSGLLLLYAAAAGFGGAAVIAYLMKRGLAEEKAWIEETLGAADRVTAGEAAVVHRLEDAHTILAPLADVFGAARAGQIERFLVLQARLGILRKTLQKLDDENSQRAVEKQMDELRAQMDEARRAVGAYAMVYLRGIFPDGASPVWSQLESALQERAARPPAGGASLWGTLSQRTSQPAPDAPGQE